MMRRAGLSCHRKDAKVLIIFALEELLSSCRSKIVGYAAKDFSRCCLLQVSANVEAHFWRKERGGKGFLGRPLSVLGWGCEVVGFWWVETLGGGCCQF